MYTTSPQHVIPRSIIAMLSGATCYPRERVNTAIRLEDERVYRVFREVIMRDNPPQAVGGVFRVWFYAVTTPYQTILMSQTTKLFFVGMPGFRGKMWILNDDTGEFGGIYQFDTVDQARDYAFSFAMKLSKRRTRNGLFRIEWYTKDGEQSLFRAQTDPLPVQPL